MEQATKDYLDNLTQVFIGKIDNLDNRITSFESHIKELLGTTINPIERDIERLRKNDEDLYEKDREMRERAGDINNKVAALEQAKIENGESRVSKLEENNDGKKNTTATTIAVISLIIAAVAVVAGLIV